MLYSFLFPSTLISSISGTVLLGTTMPAIDIQQHRAKIYAVTSIVLQHQLLIKVTSTEQKATQTSLTGKRFCDSTVAKEHDLWRYEVPWVLIAGFL